MADDPKITDPRDPYKRRDVVAELDRWLRVYDFAGLIDVAVIQRAHDEIVALREMREAHIRMLRANLNDVRDQTLDEAARVCEGGYTTESTASTLKAIAAAIRALKEKGT